jgi:hypothetical protein
MASTKATELAQLSRKLTYNEGTNEASIPTGTILTTGDNTDDLSEGSTNLYYTNARVDAQVDSHLSGGTGVTYTNGVISIDQAVSTTSDVTLANVTVDSLILTGGTDANAGTLSWNADEGTLDVALENGVVLQTGQEQHFYGKATEAISNGDVVMFAGAQGDHLLIAKADEQSVGFAPEFVIGVATQDFANNEFGYVTSFGKVRGLDTSAYAEGTVLYLDPTTAGGFTTTKPTPPNHVVQVAAVTRAHANEGTLLVRPIHMVDTDEVTEGSTNLYYTDARVASYLSANDYDTATNIIAAITDSAPGTLDTLNELAAALGDDPNFATTVTTSLADKISRTADDTDALSEGATNLYYTDGRVQAVVTQTYINNLNVDADTLDGQHYDEIISEATALAIALG